MGELAYEPILSLLDKSEANTQADGAVVAAWQATDESLCMRHLAIVQSAASRGSVATSPDIGARLANMLARTVERMHRKNSNSDVRLAYPTCAEMRELEFGCVLAVPATISSPTVMSPPSPLSLLYYGFFFGRSDSCLLFSICFPSFGTFFIVCRSFFAFYLCTWTASARSRRSWQTSLRRSRRLLAVRSCLSVPAATTNLQTLCLMSWRR